jgi:hypothetical protein
LPGRERDRGGDKNRLRTRPVAVECSPVIRIGALRPLISLYLRDPEDNRIDVAPYSHEGTARQPTCRTPCNRRSDWDSRVDAIDIAFGALVRDDVIGTTAMPGTGSIVAGAYLSSVAHSHEPTPRFDRTKPHRLAGGDGYR